MTMSKEMTVGEAIKRINEFALHHAIQELPNSTRTVGAFEMAIDALEIVSKIVLCGECIYRSQTLRGSWCTNSKSCCHGCLVRKDFFCADGKRKDGSV